MNDNFHSLTVLSHKKSYRNGIEDSRQRFGREYSVFMEDRDFRDSLSMKVFPIDESSNHLTPEYPTEAENRVNWHQMIGMRNRFAQEYMDMNKETIFETAIHDIPKFKEFISKEFEIGE